MSFYKTSFGKMSLSLWASHSFNSLARVYLEPIGSSLPKLVGDSKIYLVTKRSSEIVSLVCPAQGMPIPAFRSLH